MSTGEPQQLPGSEVEDLGPNIIEQYGKQIAFGAIALVIVFAAGSFIANSGRAGAEESWSEFAGAESASDFANVASNHPDTEVAIWARLTEGEMLLRESVQLQFTDRAASAGQFKKAGEAFDSVLGKSNLPATAKERALLGKARLLEATSDGNMDAAIAAYEQVKGIPNSIYASLVDSRIEALKQEETKAFYAWFSKQTPKPEDRARPQDGLPAGHPELPVTLPPIPEELFPADWSELDVDDAPPFETPDETEENTGNETPTDGGSKGDDSADGEAAPALKVPTDDAANDDSASESSTQE